MQGIKWFIVWHYNLITGETLFFSADELNENDDNKRTKKSSEKSKKPTTAIPPPPAPPSSLGISRINVSAEVHKDKQGRFSYLNIVSIINESVGIVWLCDVP